MFIHCFMTGNVRTHEVCVKGDLNNSIELFKYMCHAARSRVVEAVTCCYSSLVRPQLKFRRNSIFYHEHPHLRLFQANDVQA